MKWWLIEDDDVQKIRAALEQHGLTYALHALDSGLHDTDAVPADFEEEKNLTFRPQDKGKVERELRAAMERLKKLKVKERDLPPAAFRYGG